MDNQNDVEVQNPIVNKDEVAAYRDPLFLELDDKEFLKHAKALKRETDDFYSGKTADKGFNLAERRTNNENYYWGRQNAKVKLKKYQSDALDNILWESSAYINAMAVSKLPDITVKPGNDTDDSEQTAVQLSRIVTSDIQSRERKRVLKMAFKHLPVELLGVIKAFWNPQKGAHGDYDFRAVHPELITLDHRAATNDSRAMDYVFELCEATVKELVMMFPDKEKELYKELRDAGEFGEVGEVSRKSENNEEGMNSKVKYYEVWFKWYVPQKSEDSDEKNTYQEIIGVAWYYNNLLFKKMKHPYWDWTGTPQTFSYQYKEVQGKENTYTREKQPASEDMLRQQLATGQPNSDLKTETTFHNHLDYPEMPYIFMGFDQWGKQPIDETSYIEQNLPLQRQYDKRNRQIDEKIDRSGGKHVYSAAEGMTKDDVAENDPNNPEQDMLVKGKVNEVHAFIPGEQPSAQMIQSASSAMERIFDKAGTHAATRGQVDNETAATNTQIAREGDYGRMDDYVDDTINYAAEKMANWILQFIKLFYTEDHLKRLIGADGKMLFMKLNRDLIEDGMEVTISASGSDKLKAEQRAMDMAKMKLIDPLTFYNDIGASDPKGRTEKLMIFLMHPDLYLQKYVPSTSNDGAMLTQNLQNAQQGQVVDPNNPQPPPPQPGNQPPAQGGGQSPQALQDIMMIEQGQIPQVPTQIDDAYLQTMSAFMQSPDLQQVLAAHPELKQPLMDFFKQIEALAQGQGQQNVGQQPQQSNQGASQFGQEGGASVGPITGNPQPGNTSQINLNPPR